MNSLMRAVLLWVSLAASGGLAQVVPPYPPGYPGGGGVGLPVPHKGRKAKKPAENQNDILQQFSGVLNRLDEHTLVLETEDEDVITFRRADQTQFLRDDKPVEVSRFKLGDEVLVEAKEYQEGKFEAVHVIWQKAGKPPKPGAAQAPREEPQTDPDPDRPHLHRAAQPGEKPAEAAPAAAPPPSEAPAPREQAAVGPQTDPDPDRPHLQRAAQPGEKPAEAAPAAAPPPSEPPAPREQAAVGPPVPPDAPPPPPDAGDDPGAPVLHRGKPTRNQPRRKEEEPAPAPAAAPAAVQTASARVPEPAPIPEADPRVNDPVYKAREAAAAFTETLPNYVCQEFVTRYQSETQHPDWRPIDVVSAAVVYEDGKESYRNLTIDGKPVKKNMEELGGAWSTGEFGTVLVDVLSPATAADFTFRRNDSINGRAAKIYDFTVDREHSHWRIHSGAQEVTPSYQGSIWIDNQTSRVLRIEMQTLKMPARFPLDKAESATDYDFVRLGGTQQFLLPVKAEILSCQRGTPYCSRNRIEFRNYHKYEGESSIIFTDEKK